jgi:phosphonoacetaldehyde hydrolase
MTADGHPTRIRAVVFDWSGTTIDHGSMAPAAAFVELFRRRRVEITLEEARRPMGRYKLDHIRALLADRDIRERWCRAWGTSPTDADALEMYRAFQPIQLETIERYRELIPGVSETVAELRLRGIRIGSTTGYWAEATRRCADAAAEQGYRPDALVCPDDVPAGRPEPWMLFRNLELLRVYPPAAVIKVGDTPVDMEEARSAGTWAVGVSLTGNEVGLTHEELQRLEASARRELRERATANLREAGAHEVVEDVTGVPAAIAAIEERLGRGERP